MDSSSGSSNSRMHSGPASRVLSASRKVGNHDTPPKRALKATSAPTSIDSDASGPSSQTFNFRSCLGDFDASDLSGGVVDVEFVYDVESTKDLNEDEETTMLEALELAMVDSIFKSECKRRLGSRRLELHSVSPGSRDRLQGSCEITTDAATSCTRYDGSVKIGFNTQGDNDNEEQAGNTALEIVTRDMVDNNYLDEVNIALALKAATDESIDIKFVTKISYVGTSFYNASRNGLIVGVQAENSVGADEGGLTVLGRSFLPVMVLLSLGALVGFFLSYRSQKRQHGVAQLAVLRVKYDNEYLKRQSEYRDPFENDLRDLALRSSNQDVHRCNDINCVACSRQRKVVLQQFNEVLGSLDDSEFQTSDAEFQTSDGDDREPTRLIVSPITLPDFFGDRNPFRSTSTQPNIEHDEGKERDDQRTMDRFDDELPGVTFIPVRTDAIGLQPNFLRTTWAGIIGDTIDSTESMDSEP